MRRREKSGVMKIEHYWKTCWLRKEETRYLQLQIHKLRAFHNTGVLQKHGKIHILSLDQIVRWVIGSFEFLTRDYFFVRWLNSRSVNYPGDTTLWSWWSSLFQKAEVVRRCCTWSWTCLAALEASGVICVQKWTKLSHGAPVQLLSRILGLSSAWWRIGSRRNIRLCWVSLQSSSLPSTLDALSTSMHVRRANYQAAIWRRALHPAGALFLAHMAMAGSASLNVEMILEVIPPLKSNGWLVLLPHRLCWTWSCAAAHRVAPHSVVDAAKDIFTEMKFVPPQTARISLTSDTIRCTRWPSDWWWPMTSYCIVLYFFNSSAGKSQLIIPVY